MLIAACTIALQSGAALAQDAVRLRALQDCPPASDDDACVEMMMRWDAARTDRPRIVANADKAERVIAVRGRLGKGRVRAFELAVAPHDHGDEKDLGVVAYLGRSSEWRPIVATDQGALAIETRGVQVGRSQGVAIIDERTRKVAASYLSGLSGGTYIVRGPDKVIVLSKAGVCLSAPPSLPGTLSPASGCDRNPAVGENHFSERIAGDFKPASDAQLAVVRAVLPQARDLSDAQLRARTGRLGPHHLIVTPWARVEATGP
jgi:hypothetical protein